MTPQEAAVSLYRAMIRIANRALWESVKHDPVQRSKFLAEIDTAPTLYPRGGLS